MPFVLEPESKCLHLLLFSGQSNMDGFRSDLSALPASDLDEQIPYSAYKAEISESSLSDAAGVYRYLRPMTLTQTELDSLGETATGWTSSGTLPDGVRSWGFGPEITCARSLYRIDRNIGVVKWSLGGKNLDIWFNPSPEGIGFKGIRNYMQGMESTLRSEGTPFTWMGAVWWQGEEDSEQPTMYPKYKYNLRRWIEHVRCIAKNPTMPVVICKTLTPAGAEGIAVVQQAQEEVAAEVPNVALYDPSHLTLYSDNVHWHSDSHVIAGTEIAALIESMHEAQA